MVSAGKSQATKTAAKKTTAAKAKGPSKSVATRLPRGASRQIILSFLADRGGEIVDKSGRATTILHDDSGYPGSMGGMAALLQSMEAEGVITRAVNGRRCSRIALTQMPKPVEPEVTEPEPAGMGMRLLGEKAVVQEPDSRYDELAWSLLRAAAEVIHNGADGISVAELQQRLSLTAEYLDHSKQEIARMEHRWDQERNEIGDELRAAKDESRGLRERLRRAEDNNSILLGQLQRRQPAGTDAFRELDQLVRSAPGTPDRTRPRRR